MQFTDLFSDGGPARGRAGQRGFLDLRGQQYNPARDDHQPTSSQINGQISSHINIQITKIQDISRILDKAMFHHSQQEDK
eukprot:8246516-Pyramimonas_sp.AAC.1